MFFDFWEKREKKRQIERDRAENRGSEEVMSHVYYVNTPPPPLTLPLPFFFTLFEGCTVSLLLREGEAQVQFHRKREDGAPPSSMSSLPASFHPQPLPPTVCRLVHHPPAAVHICSLGAALTVRVCVCV